jgi:ribokinase
MQPQIAVVGSINLDLVVRCSVLPRPGETIMADSLAEVCGGKGANQAVAVTRAGGKCALIGRVGDDDFGKRLVEGLRGDKVDCASVKTTSECSSGVAIVSVEASGENAITVVPGANRRLCPADVVAARATIENSDALLVQLEVPLDAVTTAVEIAQQAGVRVILDPAPAPAVMPPALFAVDLLCPNESEAAVLTSLPVESDRQVAAAAQVLHERGAKAVVLTLGQRGAWLSEGGEMVLIPAFPAKVVDTTAAGDAFAGACAVHWAEHGSLAAAVRFASAAGALATTQAGAQPSLASRSQIDALCAN